MKKGLTNLLLILLLVATTHGVSHAATAKSDYGKANKMFSAGKFKDALVLYQSILSLPSRDIATSILYTKIGDSHFQLKDYRNALDAYRSALKDQKFSERPVTQYWIGFCCIMQGKDTEAIAEFLKIPENYPTSGMWITTAYYWAGRASERAGRKDQAAEYYRKASGSGKSTQDRYALKKADAVKNGVKGE